MTAQKLSVLFLPIGEKLLVRVQFEEAVRRRREEARVRVGKPTPGAAHGRERDPGFGVVDDVWVRSHVTRQRRHRLASERTP
jgi:hypothetical protein